MATEKRLIDAIALISKARRMETTDNNGIPVDTFAVPVMAIEDAPTVDAVEVKHGRWILPTKINGRTFDIPHCSVCNGVPPGVSEHTKYCSHCGAKMDGDGNG